MMRRALPPLTLALLASCEGGADRAALRADDGATRASDIAAAISADSTGDQLTIHLSAPSAERLGLCVIAAGERCEYGRATPATRVFNKNGRDILALSQKVQASADRTYVVVDDQSRVLGQFRLTDKNADPVSTGLALIDKETLRQELTWLTQDELQGRLSATPENDKVADWLIDNVKKLGLKPVSGEDFRQRFTLRVGPTSGRETANIAALIEGNDPVLKTEYVVIGAHMDHAGTLQRGYTCSPGSGGGGDQICNGADDNGSGTIAVLNAAKALAATRAHLKRSVIVMWFSGEEEGLLGSQHYVAHPLVPLDKTVYMVNMDMVGYMRSFGNALAALGGGSDDNGKKILEEISAKYPGTPLKISEQAGGGSDHVPFMSKGIPGVFFHTGVSNNPNYHRTSDHVDKIDFDGMAVAAKVGFETVLKVANSGRARTYADAPRAPLVTEEEMQQSCHHLIKNPFVAEIRKELDFTNGNDGGRS